VSDEKSARTYLNTVATRLKDDVDTLRNNFTALNRVCNAVIILEEQIILMSIIIIRGKKVGGLYALISERRWNCWRNNWN